jgi:hypothetical protein
MEKKGCFFQGTVFSQPSLFIVKEMMTFIPFLLILILWLRDGEEAMFLPA